MKNKKREFLKKKSKVLCLLTYRPTRSLIELFVSLYDPNDEYDYYVVVDDNEYKSEVDKWKDSFKKVKWIYIKEEDCKRLGYKNINFVVKEGEPSAWDKAMCYFCEKMKNHTYEKYWFMEDDVFIPKTDNLYKIDMENVDEDLLLHKKKTNMSNIEKRQMIEVKRYLEKGYESYLCKSMVCIVRMSKAMMNLIYEYVKRNKTMFFLEFFLCTLGNRHGMKMKVISELSTVLFRRMWKLDNMIEHSNYLYHPIKNVDLQKAYRQYFEPNELLWTFDRMNKMKEDSKIRKVSERLLQTVLMKKENDKNEIQKMKVTEMYEKLHDSKRDIIKKSYVDYCKMYINDHKNVFYYCFDVPNIKEASTYLFVQGYEFESFYMTIEEVYQYKDVYITIMNIPLIKPYMKIKSYSKEELEECYEYLGLEKKDSKSFEKIVQETNLKYGMDIRPTLSLEFDQMKKMMEYGRMEKEYNKKNGYQEMVNDQLKLYNQFVSSMGNTWKIYNEREVKLWF